MVRVMSDFVELLKECNSIQQTKTADLLISLSEGDVVVNNLQEGDVPMFINKSVTEIGKISYASTNRIEYNSWSDEEASNLSNRQRVKTKVGRVINKIFQSSFLESYYEGKMNNDIEVFTSQLKAKFVQTDDDDFVMEASFGDYAYYQTCEDAQEGAGTLGDSCMRHESCQDDGYFDLYSDENTPVQLITHADAEGGIRSRALLWTTSEGKFLDRIYETHDGDMDKFKGLAQKHGWTYKQRQSYTNKVGWVNDGNHFDKSLIIEVGDFDALSNYPYIDTFSHGFYHEGNSYLTNDRKFAYRELLVTKFKTFDCTGGGYSNTSLTAIKRMKEDLTTYNDVVFDERTYVLTSENTNNSNILNIPIGESQRYARYNEDGDLNIIVHDASYYHISEGERCMYSSNWYPKGKVTLMDISWGGGQPLPANPRYFVKDWKGTLQPKNSCSVFFDKYDISRVVNTSETSERVIRDIVGVPRLKSQCTYMTSRGIDGYVHEKEVMLLKILTKRVSQATDIANTNYRDVLNY